MFFLGNFYEKNFFQKFISFIKERLEISEPFNTNNRQNVCIIPLKAGGTGLNLTGTNVVIHLDHWRNYAVEE